jgi:hypothetical protein
VDWGSSLGACTTKKSSRCWLQSGVSQQEGRQVKLV